MFNYILSPNFYVLRLKCCCFNHLVNVLNIVMLLIIIYHSKYGCIILYFLTGYIKMILLLFMVSVVFSGDVRPGK